MTPPPPAAIAAAEKGRALRWITSGDTGVSSKTIWAVMMGAVHEDGDYCWPMDSGDFGRCVRLLNLMPNWRKRLPEVAAIFPEWKPLVDAWDELERLYVDEWPEGLRDWRTSRFYAKFRPLEKQAAALSGRRIIVIDAEAAAKIRRNIDGQEGGCRGR